MNPITGKKLHNTIERLVPKYTCPSIDRIIRDVHANISGRDAKDITSQMEDVRNANHGLRGCAEDALEALEALEDWSAKVLDGEGIECAQCGGYLKVRMIKGGRMEADRCDCWDDWGHIENRDVEAVLTSFTPVVKSHPSRSISAGLRAEIANLATILRGLELEPEQAADLDQVVERLRMVGEVLAAFPAPE